MRKLLHLGSCLCMLLLLISSTAFAEKITDYSNIVSGHKYYIGATTGTTDYYLSLASTSASTGGTKGTAVTSTSSAAIFVVEGSGTSWSFKIDGTSNYLNLKDGKDNGCFAISANAPKATLSNQSGKIRISYGSYSVQKNNSGTQFGSYANTQTDVWLEEYVEPTGPVDASWSVSPSEVTVGVGSTAKATITTNYDGTLSVSSSATGVATASIDGKEITVTGVAAGTATITVTGSATSTYNAVSKTISVTVESNERPANEIFYESFNSTTGKGGNDDAWSGSIATSTLKYDNEGWTVVSGSGADACAKFGTGSIQGSAMTPALGTACNATMTFKAGAWNSSSEKTTLNLSVEGGGTVSPTSVTMTRGAWTSYEVTLTGLTASSKIKFTAAAASSSRFFLDEVSVVSTGSVTPPATKEYTVTIATDIVGGSISSSVEKAEAGATVSLSATPADGYTFTSWNVTGATVENATSATTSFVMPSEDVTVSATFTKNQSTFDGTITTMSAADGADIKFVQGSSATDGAVWATSTPLTANGISLSGDVTSGTNYSYYDGKVVRFYTNNEITITPAAGTTIVKVEFVRQTTTGSNGGEISCDGLTASSANTTTNTNVFTGSATSAVTFTASAQARFTDILVYTTSGSTTPTDKELIGIYTTGTATALWKGDAFTTSGITVMALWDDETETDVTSLCEFAGYDMKEAGTQTVQVSYEGETCTYSLEVKTIANDYQQPYTVEEAVALINAGKDLNSYVFIKGVVSSIPDKAFNATYGSITYFISTDGTTTSQQFEVYGGLGIGTQKFESVDDIQLGDEVVVCGLMKKFSSTYEVDKNNYLIEHNKNAELSIADIVVSVNDDITPEITTNIQGEYLIEYVSNNEEVVLAADDEMVPTGVGVATITATIVADGYKTATTTFSVTVTSGATLESITIGGELAKSDYTTADQIDYSGLTVMAHYSDASSMDVTSQAEWSYAPETLTADLTNITVIATYEGKTAQMVCPVSMSELNIHTWDLTKADYSTASAASVNWVCTGVTMSLDKNVSTTNANNYLGGTGEYSHTRLYQNQMLVFTPASGIAIQKIELTGVSGYVAGYTAANTWTNAEMSIDGTKVTLIPTDGTKDVEGLISSASRLTGVTVYYAGSAAVALSSITLSCDMQTTFAQGDAYNFGGTVTANYTDGTSADVTKDAVFTGYDASTVGTQTITVSYTEGGVTATETYDILVSRVLVAAANGYEEVNFLTQGYANQQVVDNYAGTSMNLMFEKPEKSTTPTKYYASGTAVRAYTGNTITIEAKENILGVNIDWAKGYADEDVDITVNGTTAVVTFSKTCRFTNMTVYYAVESIEATLTNDHLTLGDEFDAANVNVTAIRKDGTTEQLHSFITSTTPDVSTIGVKEITVEALGKSTTASLYVADPDDQDDDLDFDADDIPAYVQKILNEVDGASVGKATKLIERLIAPVGE